MVQKYSDQICQCLDQISHSFDQILDFFDQKYHNSALVCHFFALVSQNSALGSNFSALVSESFNLDCQNSALDIDLPFQRHLTNIIVFEASAHLSSPLCKWKLIHRQTSSICR